MFYYLLRGNTKDISGHYKYIFLYLYIIYILTYESEVISRVRLFATPWTVAHQAPLSMEFSRQEYWSGLPFPSPGDLPDPRIEPRSPSLQADIYHLSHREAPIHTHTHTHTYI